MHYFLLLPQVTDVGTPLDIVQWSALLRSTSALDMYRAKYGRLQPNSQGPVAQPLGERPE